jgi:O-antigen/teichoic acid export membrane protein
MARVRHQNIVLSKRLVVVNSASSVLARAVNFSVLLWVYQFLLRHLSAEEFAVLPVVTALMVFAPLFFSVFTGGIGRYTIDAYAKGDFTEVRRLVSSLFPILALVAALFVLGGLLFAANIDRVFNIPARSAADARLMMALLVLSFALQMLVVPFQTAYLIRQRYLEMNLLEMGRDVLRALLLVYFLLFIEVAVLWVVVATFIAQVSLAVVTLLRALQMVPELRLDWRLFELRKARRLMSFGLWTSLGQLGAILYTSAATLILNLLGTGVDVTTYHIGATLFRQLQMIISKAASPLQPAITAMNALGDHQRLASTVLRGGRYGLWVSMLLATPLILYADLFIGLYLGADYASAATIIILFMIIFPFTQPTVLLAITAMAMEQVRAFFLPAFLFQFAGVLLMLVFVRWFGMGAVGVTLALTLITIASQLGYFWSLCLRLTGESFRSFATEVLLRGLSPAFVAALVWGGLRLIAAPDSWAGLFTYGCLGALVYFAVLLGLCLTGAERRDLRGIMQRVRP